MIVFSACTYIEGNYYPCFSVENYNIEVSKSILEADNQYTYDVKKHLGDSLVLVSFQEFFNDSITVYLNSRKSFEGFVKTNKSTAIASNFLYDREYSLDTINCVINNIDTLSFLVEEEFSHVQIYYYRDKRNFILNYSNVFWLAE